MNILKSSVEFLKKLKKNNNKQWFDQNREEYENAKQDFRVFTEKLIGETGKFDRQIAKLTARECIFRINRDIRFSKDKSPYKTNFGTFLVMGGKKSGFAGYYFHLEPGNESFSGGGIHTPSPEVLLKIRQKIAGNSETLHEILNNKIFAKSFGGVSGEKLKTVPKGFSKDQKDIELLKFKSYTVLHGFKDSEVQSHSAIERVIENFELMKSFIDFLNSAIVIKGR